jgi:hypothetical protein
VAYWRLGDSSGPLVDQTGNQNGNDHGLTFGTPGIAGAGGDTAITCPSGSNYADFSSIPSAWNVGDTFTLECWLKFASLGVAQVFIYGGSNSFTLGMDSGNNPTLFHNGTSYIAHVPAISLDSNWHHFVATKAGATTKVYWDGADATNNDANFTVSNPTSGMSLFNSSGTYLHGAMDEAAIYPTALSAARVLVHYTTGSAAPSSGPTELVGAVMI